MSHNKSNHWLISMRYTLSVQLSAELSWAELSWVELSRAKHRSCSFWMASKPISKINYVWLNKAYGYDGILWILFFVCVVCSYGIRLSVVTIKNNHFGGFAVIWSFLLVRNGSDDGSVYVLLNKYYLLRSSQ